MRIPFCEFCVKTRLFCPKCQSLLDSGQYQMLDVDVIDAVLRLSDEDQKVKDALSGVEYHKAYDVGDVVYVALKGIRKVHPNMRKLIEGRLTEVLGRPVRLIEYTTDVNDLVTQIAYPARPIVATTWLPDGTNETEVRIFRSDMRRLKIKPSEMARLLSALTNSNVKVRVVGRGGA